jgi:hypothetical protein
LFSGWECLLTTAWRQGRALNGDAMVFYGVEIFVLFSSIWDVCVVVGRMMTVWQGSCQVKCRQQKSHGGMAKR